MSDRGRFSGFSWHTEFHTINPKREKAADCIYLTTDRLCQNKKCIKYMEKCFIATNCPFRVREKDAEKVANAKVAEPTPTPKKKLPIKKIKCSLPMGCKMRSNKFGQGRLVDYNEASMIISVQFEEKIVRFQYPNAIIDKHLILPKPAFSTVLYDMRHAERG